jgi:hypothetical protein
MMKDFKIFCSNVIGLRMYQGVNQKGLLISICPMELLQLINKGTHTKAMWSFKIDGSIDSIVSSESIALEIYQRNFRLVIISPRVLNASQPN